MHKRASRLVAIGNSEYQNLGKLRTPRNNIEALKEKLTPLGYDVRARFNLEKAETLDLFESISKEWQHLGSEIIFYYTGRAISIGKRCKVTLS